MYDPVGWMDESYFDRSYNRLSVKQRRLLNEIILSSIDLTPISLEALSPFEMELIAIWPSLRRVFTLMAYFRYKAFLLSSRKKHQLDPDAIKFAVSLNTAALTSAVFKADTASEVTESRLQMQAYQEMVSFCNYLSEPIRQRLSFLFPESVTHKHDQHRNHDADFLLLRIACNHVRTKN